MTKSPPVDGHDADQDDLSGEDNSKDGSVDDTMDEPSTQWWMWQNSPAGAATDGPQDDQRTDSNAKDDKDDNSKPKSAASPRDDGPSSPEQG